MVSTVCQSAIVPPGGVEPPAGLRFRDGRGMAACHRLSFIAPVSGNPDAGSLHGPTMSKSDGRTIIAQPGWGADKAGGASAFSRHDERGGEGRVPLVRGPGADSRGRYRQALRQKAVFPWDAYQRYTSLSYRIALTSQAALCGVTASMIAAPWFTCASDKSRSACRLIQYCGVVPK